MSFTDINKLAEINKEFNCRYPGHIIDDGVADFEAFEKVNPKILWIFKECNDPNKTSWSLREFMRTGVKGYPRWKCVWGMPVMISYALVNNIKDFRKIPPEAEIERILKHVAAINVKKVGGLSRADDKIVAAYYQKDKDLLLQQIEAISPNVIINCSRVWDLFCDLKVNDVKSIAPFQVAKSKYGPLINAYHPNRRNLSKENYFEIILKCLVTIG